MLNRSVKALLVAALGAFYCASALAEANYPTRPIKIVVPFGPGGPTDWATRVLSEKLSEQLKQTVIIENKPGATAQIGSTAVARSAPDGYTLLMANSTSHSTSPVVTKQMPYDPVKDFVPIVGISKYASLFVCNNQLPAEDLQQLITYGKKNPAALSVGTTGIGSGAQFMAALLGHTMGVKILTIPYKGNSESINAVIAGHVSCMFDGGAKPHVDAKRVKALGVTSVTRDRRLPSVPTLDEQGVTGFDLFTWMGLEAPKGTSPEIVKKLNTAVNTILKDPNIRTRFAEQGMEVLGGNPEALEALVLSEMKKHQDIVKKTGITFE